MGQVFRGTTIVGGGIQTIASELKIALTGESLSPEESLARKSDGSQSVILGLIGLTVGVFALDMINKNSPPVNVEGVSDARAELATSKY